MFNGLESCGYLCAATGRAAEAVTVWAALAALTRQAGLADLPEYARRRDEALQRARQALRPPGPARPRTAARR